MLETVTCHLIVLGLSFKKIDQQAAYLGQDMKPIFRIGIISANLRLVIMPVDTTHDYAARRQLSLPGRTFKRAQRAFAHADKGTSYEAANSTVLPQVIHLH